MKSIALPEFGPSSDCSVAIGIFDGVHLGHQRVLAETRASSVSQQLMPIGLTFDTHPIALFAPDRAPAYICSVSQKVEWMTSAALVERVVVAHFDHEFAQMSPRTFAEDILVGRLRAREVRVGADFRFGKDRAGSVMDLESLGEQYGFTVSVVHAVARGGERISSSKIRELVGAGKVADAAKLIGRPFTLRGQVVRGKQLGRTIGFPTVNVKPEMPRQLLPANGVYSGYAVIDGVKSKVRAAISIGTNPTTDGGDDARKVEAFLLDGFSRDTYGETVDLEVVARVRDEQRFDSVDRLIAEIGRDVAAISQSLPVIDYGD